ncbi:MAG: helix-turn-helix transcriptional regulator, partial [Clostridia bacterium]|nr:helix-turn-helix transcriptional regulator [Clostridia bacterium]
TPAVRHHGDNFKNRLVCDVIYYIDSHLFSMKNLTDISHHLGYSYSYISQLFSETMGVGLKSYFQEQRFAKAAELMQRHISVTQIAEMLGFDSASSFSRSFKKRYGMSPSAYGELAESKAENPPDRESIEE